VNRPRVTTLPDGRTVAVADEALDRLCCGVVVLDPVAVRDEPALAEATEKLGARLRERHAGRLPSEIPGLAEARTLYRSFGMEPTRHRPSSEALLRRVLKGKGLYRISSVVDACNLSSLAFLLPIGMYDLDRVRGNVTLRAGRPGEEYPGIRKGTVRLEGRLGLFDDDGPFGSPTSDSARTCTTADTTAILAVVMATAAHPAAEMEAHLDVLAGNFVRFCGAVEAHRAVLGGATS